MTRETRSLLIFGGVLAAVIGLALFYVRTVRTLDRDPEPVAPSRTSAERPVAQDLHPEVVAGRAALAEGRLEDAVRHLQNVPSGDPGYLIALMTLARTHTAAGNHAGALVVFEQLVAIESESPEIQAGLAAAQHRVGRSSDAELSALRALELNPELLIPRWDLGLFRAAQGQAGGAIDTYHRALRRDPERRGAGRAERDLLELHAAPDASPAVHYALAFFANLREDFHAEIDELTHYIELAPEGPAFDVARQRLEAMQAYGGS